MTKVRLITEVTNLPSVKEIEAAVPSGHHWVGRVRLDQCSHFPCEQGEYRVTHLDVYVVDGKVRLCFCSTEGSYFSPCVEYASFIMDHLESEVLAGAFALLFGIGDRDKLNGVVFENAYPDLFTDRDPIPY